jgi:transposase
MPDKYNHIVLPPDVEALKEDKAGAEYAMEQIGMLYKVEDMASDQQMDDEQRAEL